MPGANCLVIHRVGVGLAACAAVLVLLVSAAAGAFEARLASDLTVVDLRAEGDSSAAPASSEGSPASPDASAASGPAGRSPSQPLSVLLIGSDTRAGRGNDRYGSATAFGDPRADVTMLLHVPADRQWAYLLSVPRDLVVEIPVGRRACGGPGDSAAVERTRVNEALSRGGVPCVVGTLENLLPGLRVDHAAVVDFAGFAEVIDVAGGLPVCLRSPVVDESADLDLPAGAQNLTGVEALGLMRARKALADGSDIARTERQQFLLRGLVARAQNQSLGTDLPRLFQLATTVARSLTVDRELASPSRLAEVASAALTAAGSRLYTRTLPWTINPADPMGTVLPDTERLEQAIAVFARSERPKSPQRAPASQSHSDPTDVFCSK